MVVFRWFWIVLGNSGGDFWVFLIVRGSSCAGSRWFGFFSGGGFYVVPDGSCGGSRWFGVFIVVLYKWFQAVLSGCRYLFCVWFSVGVWVVLDHRWWFWIVLSSSGGGYLLL